MNNLGPQTSATHSLFRVAFCLVPINGYDLAGALQDHWNVYWYSLVSHLVAKGCFWTLEKPWDKLIAFEEVTFAVLGVSKWFA